MSNRQKICSDCKHWHDPVEHLCLEYTALGNCLVSNGVLVFEDEPCAVDKFESKDDVED